MMAGALSNSLSACQSSSDGLGNRYSLLIHQMKMSPKPVTFLWKIFAYIFVRKEL
jgi:hypothetical protein